MSKKPIKLALSGSGTVFYYHIGALKRILEEYYIESAIASSGGTFPLSLLASGKSILDIEKMAYSVKLSDFVDYSWNPFDRFGLISGDRLLKFLEKEIPIKINETKFPLIITTTNMTKGKSVEWFNSNKPLALLVRASMSIPFLFKHVMIDNEIHVDGGVMNNFPIDYFQANNVIGVSIKAPKVDFNLDIIQNQNIIAKLFTQTLTYGFRVIELMMEAVEKKHLEDAQYAKTIKIESKYSGYDFNHNKDAIRDMIKTGYNTTHEYLKNKS